MDRSRYLSYWGGRFAPKFMAGINRNRRRERIGMSGRNSPENALSDYTAERLDNGTLTSEDVSIISKPVSPKDLLHKLREILNN